ncbi:MAG: membrane dipeptidase, partial [Chlamydiae bacterium]|nr:membrane dipeptidase [Chlamydiota bacterium]
KGIIGLVFFKLFVNPNDYRAILSHIKWGLEHCGENALCFGSDFFCIKDFLDHESAKHPGYGFFKEYPDASKFPFLLQLIQKELNLSPAILEKIAYKNSLRFIHS